MKGTVQAKRPDHNNVSYVQQGTKSATDIICIKATVSFELKALQRPLSDR